MNEAQHALLSVATTYIVVCVCMCYVCVCEDCAQCQKRYYSKVNTLPSAE